VPDIPAIYTGWKEIVRDHKVQGVKVYDARLVATMKVYALESILTFNAADFNRYRAITALGPSSSTRLNRSLCCHAPRALRCEDISWNLAHLP
jgi:hypothetical protein